MDKNIIGQSPFFSGLAPDLLTELAKIAVLKKYKAGDHIFAEGDKGTGFYLVARGLVKIYKNVLSGKEQILHIFGPGEPFG
ncbi:MAG: Crp/Fnr family transcriptional regulator, partial [Candidatus Adiutrix sp.]